MAYTPQIGTRFWFELDRATLYSASFMKIVSRAGAGVVQDKFRTTRLNGTYPDAFRQAFLPHRADWIQLAEVQSATIKNVLGTDWSDIQAAFEDFGQGILLDTDQDRKDAGDSIHMMDGQDNNPPIGYHRWHASLRVIQMLNIGDTEWWENLDRLVGLAWGTQSFLKPRQQDVPNAGIAQADMQELRNVWLPLDSNRRDRQYDLTAGAFGFHPSPKHPG